MKQTTCLNHLATRRNNASSGYGWVAFLAALLLVGGCVGDREYKTPGAECVPAGSANIDFSRLLARYEGKAMKIEEELFLEAYVVSSDEAGNIFGSLYLQDRPALPRVGVQLEMDLRGSHLFYPPGARVLLKLRGLYLGKSGPHFKLGGAFSAFGNLSIGRLPAPVVARHLFWTCEQGPEVVPYPITVAELHDSLLNTLVRLQEIQLNEEELGNAFAPPREEVLREMEDCNGNLAYLINSGYARFGPSLLPEGNGTATGVLRREGKDYGLVIRDTGDLDFSGERCPGGGMVQSSNRLFISELADPDNNADARFVELFNSGAEELSLNQWVLRRYTNDQTTVSSTLDLSGLRIAPKSTLLIAADAIAFEAAYGFPPDLEAGSNGPADSNGDDTIALVDPFGQVVDLFGVIGEDGSGTNHEFEDGRAQRKAFVEYGNPVYTFSEWEVYNDSGQAGTQNLPRNAPDDFSPGQR